MALKLFGTSGIRGVVNEDLTPTLALEAGLAVATRVSGGKALVGRDTRVSGVMLESALTAGLLAGGSTVGHLGVVPTPTLAFLTKEMKADVGVMITASHNPPEYNGIKLFSRDGMAYDEKKQGEIEEIIERKLFRTVEWRDIGKIRRLDVTHRYVDAILESVQLERSWRVVVDPGCGATCDIAPSILRKLGCKVTALNAQPDGFFPGRNPLPTTESLRPLCRLVRELGADVGLAYDGDGDRVLAVDELGNVVPLDQALAAYAAHVVAEKRGGVVVTHVEASMCIEEAVEKEGGRVVRTRVGDVNVAMAIRRHKAVFGGEPCGAWIHPQYHYCPDGILSSVLLLKMLEEKEASLSSVISEVPAPPIIRISLACPNDLKPKVMQKLEEVLPGEFPTAKEKLVVDGLRLAMGDAWVLVRPSGTEPLIRVTTEAKSKREAEQIIGKTARLVKNLVLETRA